MLEGKIQGGSRTEGRMIEWIDQMVWDEVGVLSWERWPGIGTLLELQALEI